MPTGADGSVAGIGDSVLATSRDEGRRGAASFGVDVIEGPPSMESRLPSNTS